MFIRYTSLVVMMLLPALVRADAVSLDVPNTSSYADTESTTNVVFNAGDTDDRLFRLSLELNATADNNVSVLFGTDARTANVECKMGNEECMSEESFYILHSAFSICSSILR